MELKTLSLRRSNHVRRLVERYSPIDFDFSFVLSSINGEPRSVKEAVNCEEGKLWKKAMI